MIHLVLALWLYAQELHSEPRIVDGRCSICLLEGKRSEIRDGACTQTLMAPSSGYDSEGRYFYRDPNYTTCSWQCTAGHAGTVRYP